MIRLSFAWILLSICLLMAKILSINQEVDEEEVDYILHGLHRIGDPERLWPTSLYVLKNEICGNYNKELFKVIYFVLEKFENNYNVQIIARLYVNELMRLMNSYCSDSETRDKVLKTFRALNDKVYELKAPREKLLTILDRAAADRTKPESVGKLACYFRKFSEDISDLLPMSEEKIMINKYHDSLSRAIGGYVKPLIKNEVTSCDYGDTQTEPKPRLKSVHLTLLYALNNSLSYGADESPPKLGTVSRSASGSSAATQPIEAKTSDLSTDISEGEVFEHWAAKVSHEDRHKSHKDLVNSFKNPKMNG